MRYLIISQSGETVGLAMRLEKAGHAATVCVADAPEKGKGLVSHLIAPRSLIDRDGIVNKSVIQLLLKEAQPDVIIIDDPALEPVARALQWPRNRIISPAGDQPRVPYANGHTGPIKAVSAWFNGQDFIGPYGYHLVYNRRNNGGMGNVVPAMGTLSHYHHLRTIAFTALLAPHAPALKHFSYKGPVAVESAGGKDTLLPTFTPYTLPMLEILKGDPSQYLLDVLNSTGAGADILMDRWVCSIRLVRDEWPHQDTEPVLIDGINEHNLKHMWPSDLRYADGMYGTCRRGGGSIAIISARGTLPRDPIKRCMRTLRKLTGNGLQYRTDIGESHAEVLKTFEEMLKLPEKSGKIVEVIT